MLLCGIILLTVFAAGQYPTDDLITNLPGLTWNINYKMYSGFLDLYNNHHLFYWFIESANNPETDPIVLWLNGGPGCSSLDGLLYEQGPIHVNNTDNTLYPNPYSWNLNASIIFLESPICVGFSYTDNNECIADDNTTANDNYYALLQFFMKFPNYTKNDFFIMGESYAGVYVPVTTKRILDGNANKTNNITINIRGFGVGDPCGFETVKYFDSDMWYEYYHGWISQRMWNNLLLECCDKNSTFTHNNCHFGNPPNMKCAELVSDATKIIKDGSINYNDWIVDCHRNHMKDNQYSRLTQLLFDRVTNNNKYLKQIGFNDQIYTLCGNSNGAYNYLNRNDVREAIHANRSRIEIEWNICSNHLQYDTLQIYDNENWLYQEIWRLNNNISTLVYNGDVDAGINFLVSQWFVDNFSLPIIRDYRQWFIEYNNNGGQVGGWTIDYDKISYVTLRGAGHMVPQYRPAEALKMFQYFIQNKSLE